MKKRLKLTEAELRVISSALRASQEQIIEDRPHYPYNDIIIEFYEKLLDKVHTAKFIRKKKLSNSCVPAGPVVTGPTL